MTIPLLKVTDLKTIFHTSQGIVHAVDGVSFQIGRGEAYGLVGESGSGKTVTALSLLRLIDEPAGEIVQGSIELCDAGGKNKVDVLRLGPRELRAVRGGRIAMIFQEPQTSLNPVFTVGTQIIEAVALHRDLPASARRAVAIDLMAQVGIPQPAARIDDYPHQLSGGMRQRVMIAMALACQPDLLIADEPTTALDVTIQAQILDLIKSLQERLGMSLLLITHDLGVVAQVAERVGVMYAGQIVEEAPVGELFLAPRHPYTRGLIDSIPPLEGERQRRMSSIPGQVPSLIDPPPGCRFRDRCGSAKDRCRDDPPWVAESGHGYRCFFPVEVKPGQEARSLR